MVVQKAVDNLKQKPEEQRKAVASGVAVALVIILFIGWAYLFLKKVRGGVELDQVGTTAQQEFQFQNVRDAQERLTNDYDSAADELRRIRDEAARAAASGSDVSAGGGAGASSDGDFGLPAGY